MTDLFLKEPTKKEQVYEYIKKQGRVRTSDVIRWGLEHYHTRAERDCRDLAQEGVIWRMREDLAEMVYGKVGEGIWSCFEVDK